MHASGCCCPSRATRIQCERTLSEMLRHSTFLFLVVQAMQRVTDSFDIQHISNVLNLDEIKIEISY